MIVTKLIGGLGNQMFQFAAGLNVAKQTGQPLYLDICAFSRYKNHQGYQLPEIFSGHFDAASKWQLVSLLGIKGIKSRKIDVSVDLGFEYSTNKVVVRQAHHGYSDYFSQIKGPCYLSGYWQSEKYFGDAVSELREELSFKPFDDADNLSASEKCRAENSVAIHIRRGDYISNKAAHKFHGELTNEYYRAAISKIEDRYGSPELIVFSDEPSAAAEILGNKVNATYMRHNNGKDSYKDMHLMSLCKHHIIANSTFSWWGAWLANRNGVTIAPKNWFAQRVKGMDDIYCEGWIRL